jgi:hypothetical protein
MLWLLLRYSFLFNKLKIEEMMTTVSEYGLVLHRLNENNGGRCKWSGQLQKGIYLLVCGWLLLRNSSFRIAPKNVAFSKYKINITLVLDTIPITQTLLLQSFRFNLLSLPVEMFFSSNYTRNETVEFTAIWRAYVDWDFAITLIHWLQ